jgi:hypothetical protein
MLDAYFGALQRAPASARVYLVEIRGVSREVDKAFDAALRAIGAEVARQIAPGSAASDAQSDELLQAGVVGGVMHIALRWIDAGYQPPLAVVTDTALRLGMVLAHTGARTARQSRSAAA